MDKSFIAQKVGKAKEMDLPTPLMALAPDA